MKTLFSKKVIVFKALMVFTIFLSCRKFVEVAPPIDQIVNPIPFETDVAAVASITGIYSEMMRNNSQFTSAQTTLFAGMSADELYFFSPSFRDEFTKNEITQVNHANLTTYFWQPAYKYIYAANLVIEQLNVSTKLTPGVKQMLMGEARFIRAFCFFYLVNFFGDVPITLSSDYRVNSILPREDQSKIYIQIIEDLKSARDLLSESYPTSERVRPNKWTAAALLARAYLYINDWPNAEIQSSNVISSSMYTLEPNLDNVFLSTSQEAIWQLRPVNPSSNTWEGNSILPVSSSALPTYLVRPELLNAFETNDQRRLHWVTSRTYLGQIIFYPYKYKVFGNNAPLSEFYMVVRLAEQFLIRAEARAMQSKIGEAADDINVVRNRAGLAGVSPSDQISTLAAIEQERKIELANEWGHRWFDLKRTGKSDLILGTLKPSTWQSSDILWPIPFDQINLNSALVQNPGY